MYLDSKFKLDKNESPVNYSITTAQSNIWSAIPKDLNDDINSWTKTIVEVVDITLETYYIYPRPIMKLNVFDTAKSDNSLVNSLNSNDTFRFVVFENYNQFGFRRYASDMAIPMLFSSRSSYKIELTDVDNNFPNDISRSIITLKLTPVERFNIKYKDINYKNSALTFFNKQSN